MGTECPSSWDSELGLGARSEDWSYNRSESAPNIPKDYDWPKLQAFGTKARKLATQMQNWVVYPRQHLQVTFLSHQILKPHS